jgi:hypothetical protein
LIPAVRLSTNCPYDCHPERSEGPMHLSDY